MNLIIQQLDRLPRLCWCLTVKRDEPAATVTCGPWVEVGDDYFIEGAWDGRFDEQGFDSSSLLMGSGGKTTERGILLSTPCHNLDPLFLVCDDDQLTASNSLSFLLISAGLSLDHGYLYYKMDLRSSMYGLKRCAKNIPTKNGPDIRLLYYTNVEIDRYLNVTEFSKPPVPDWLGYDQYRDFLVSSLRDIKQNAESSKRRIRYELLTTISTGYDSTASAALAAEVGAKYALTAKTGGNEETGNPIDDSGAKIARILGLEVTEYPAPQSDATILSRLAEFAVCGDTAELNFIIFEKEVAAKLVTTGNSGGFWRLDFPASPHLARPDPGGSSLGEFRIRVGFLHVPVPMMGAHRHPRLYAISSSEEMQPWSLASAYNRPIPRRIVEDKGVPRELFGQVKKGGIVLGGYSIAALDYYRAHRNERSFRARLCNYLRWRIGSFQRRLTAWAAHKGWIWRRHDDWGIPKLGPSTLIVQWGDSIVKERYDVLSDRAPCDVPPDTINTQDELR
jgi:hypothetical protein